MDDFNKEYLAGLDRMRELEKSLKRPNLHKTFSPNTGFAATYMKDDRRVVIMMGGKAKLTEWVALSEKLATMVEKPFPYTIVKLDSSVKMYSHYQPYNNYVYMLT